MRKLLVAFVLLLGILFIITRFTEVQAILSVLQQGNLWLIGLAVLVQFIWMLIFGATFQSLFNLVGVRKNILPITRLVMAINFVNLVAPSAGMSGVAVMFSDAQRNGHPSANVMVAGALFLILDYFGLLSIILIGMVILSFYNSLHFSVVIAFLLLLALALILSGVLILAAKSEKKLAYLFSWVSKNANRVSKFIIRKEIFNEVRAAAFAAEISTGISALRNVRRGWIRPAMLIAANKILLITILGLMFLAFNVPISLGKLIAGFSVGYLFVIISPTPAGVGIVEGILTLALTSLQVPLEAATVITLAFRGVTFWLPLFIGLIAFRSLEK